MTETNYILCMKWGNKYSAEYVNRLYRMVSRHLSLPFEMVCLTDDKTGIYPQIKCYPIPELNLPANLPERGWKKLTTFKPDLYGLKGTALFLDIDIVIVDNIDCFFTHQAKHQDSVMIIRDWKKPYPDLLSYFQKNFETIRNEVRHEQAFLSNYLRKYHHLEYWDSSWCVSYKYHCLQKIPFAYFIPPKKPIGAKIVIFHGEIHPPDAIKGGGGKWYRHVLPSDWIREAWQ